MLAMASDALIQGDGEALSLALSEFEPRVVGILTSVCCARRQLTFCDMDINVAKSAGCFCAKVHSAAHKSWLPLSGAAGSAHLIHPILSLPGRGVTAVALCFKAAATLRQ